MPKSLGQLMTEVITNINSMEIHVCAANEYDSTTLVPTIEHPNEHTFYLVPDGSSTDLYTEWVRIGSSWEKFGAARVNLSGYVSDVQLDGTSILSSGVANIPMASYQNKGVVKVSSDYGITLNNNGYLTFNTGNDPTTKLGGSYNHAVLVGSQHVSTFYGLAKVAGVDLAQSGVDADEEIGHYPETAKAAIRTLIGAGTYSKPSGGIPASDLNESIPRFVYRITFNSYQFQCTIAETGAGKTVSIDPDLYESFFTGPADFWITTADEQDILYFEGLSIVKDNISGIITSEQTNTNGEPKLEIRIPFAPRGNYEVILRLDQSFDNTAKVIFSQSKDVNTGIDSNLDLYTMSSKVATEDYVNTRIPAPPSSDGTYTLQLTVASGEATYAWV